MSRLLIMSALALLLTACLPMPASQPTQIHHVLTDPGPVIRAQQPLPATLLVREMDAAAFYQNPALVFSADGATRAHYAYARWSEPAAKRLTWLLRQRLEAAGAAPVVAPLGAGVSGDYQLNTRLVDFYHDATYPPGMALLLLEAELVQRATATLMARRMFVAQVPVPSHDAAGAADALGRAANRVMDDLVQWLAQAAATDPR